MAASVTLSREQRQERARGAYLAGAVRTVIRRRDELTADQLEELRQVFSR